MIGAEALVFIEKIAQNPEQQAPLAAKKKKNEEETPYVRAKRIKGLNSYLLRLPGR